ncbi:MULTISPECIES: glycosyltransferase [Clostridium]|uniref:glycosyltransferase n=1 Tax=Clostridium TaxID=1485 RepID=UPI0008243533|nr:MULTISPECIES: glycosyltransferase [Clostridium]
MLTSIIILTYNNLEYTKQCIESIRKNTKNSEYEIIVVDNCSNDGTREWLNNQEDIILILNEENVGFPKGCNQGIEVASGDNILLLNNDVIVTHNWLDNMIKCLYSSDNIGAVGPVSNSVSYYQQINTNYTNLEELIDFAQGYNVSDVSKWEDRLKLVGFCMLIKKNVLDEIGLLDEIFSPGNFEDDDLSLRIINAHYRLILCKDTFIHHYGSVSFSQDDKYISLLKTNENKFYDKWKFTTRDTTAINENLINLINEDKNGNFKVLDIGCGCGSNLLKIKNIYKNVKLFGIDKNAYALKQASNICETYNGDIENFEFSFSENKFDYIIMDNILNLLNEPELILKKLKDYLTEKGKIIVSVPNAMNYKFLYNMMMGNHLYKNDFVYNVIYDKPTLFFNYKEIKDVFLKSGYKNVTFNKVMTTVMNGDENFVNKLCGIFGQDKKEQYLIYEYIAVGCGDEKLNHIDKLIKEIEDDGFSGIEKEAVDFIKDTNFDDIIKSVDKISKDKVEVLNYIANMMFQNKYYEYVIPFLQRAFEINSKDRDTLYNISYMLHVFKEDKLAIKYLNMIENKNSMELELMNEINNKLGKNTDIQVKFLLRRIENNIEVEESKNKLITMFKDGILNCNNIISSVFSNIIKKEYILNEIAILCYENSLYDEVIPMLQKSYEINNCNSDTVYNLGYILHKFGQDELALRFLKNMENDDSEIKNLADAIRGENSDE